MVIPFNHVVVLAEPGVLDALLRLVGGAYANGFTAPDPEERAFEIAAAANVPFEESLVEQLEQVVEIADLVALEVSRSQREGLN